MYTTCLFCSASLGTNEAIGTFPVGTRVAFDAWKGRLWAVCIRCARWNLAPIEERWEAVEQAERLFVDTRARVHSENIGIARMADGSRLIRVGKALPGEFAAWRYGTQLVSRRRRNVAITGAALAGGAAFVAGLPLIAGAGLPFALLNLGLQVAPIVSMERQKRRVVLRLSAAESPSGRDVIVRRWHLYHAILGRTDAGDLSIDLPPLVMQSEWRAKWRADMSRSPDEPLQITGESAQRVLARSMVDYNSRGATHAEVERALRAIDAAGGGEAFTRKAAESGASIARMSRYATANKYGASYSFRQIVGTFRGEILPVVKYRSMFTDESRRQLTKTDALALEMALQDEAERRALEGELASLVAAWREAEEIARIADALPGEPPD